MYKIVLYKVNYIKDKKMETITYTSLEALSDFIYMLTRCDGTLINVTRKVKVL